MTDLNLKENILSVLHQIKSEDPAFFVSECRLLSWKSKKINGALVTKVGKQRFLGLIRKDKNGQEYWKYKLLAEPAPASAPSSEKPAAEPISEEKDLEPNERIKKFREKYGTPTNPKT